MGLSFQHPSECRKKCCCSWLNYPGACYWVEKRSGSPYIFIRFCKIQSLVSRRMTALKRPEITAHVQILPMRCDVRKKLFFGVAQKPLLRSWAKLANVFSFTSFEIHEFDHFAPKLVEHEQF